MKEPNRHVARDLRNSSLEGLVKYSMKGMSRHIVGRELTGKAAVRGLMSSTISSNFLTERGTKYLEMLTSEIMGEAAMINFRGMGGVREIVNGLLLGIHENMLSAEGWTAKEQLVLMQVMNKAILESTGRFSDGQRRYLPDLVGNLSETLSEFVTDSKHKLADDAFVRFGKSIMSAVMDRLHSGLVQTCIERLTEGFLRTARPDFECHTFVPFPKAY
mgnify:CR=1 FL=1